MFSLASMTFFIVSRSEGVSILSYPPRRPSKYLPMYVPFIRVLVLVLHREKRRPLDRLRHEVISYVLVLEQTEVNSEGKPQLASGFGARSGATLGSWS